MRRFESQHLKNLIVSKRLLAIKAELESEASSLDELTILSNICSKNNLPLTLKIGGCMAKRDIYHALILDSENILVPMIESSFAYSSFLNNYNNILESYKNKVKQPFIYINIESKLAYQRLNGILGSIKNVNTPLEGIVIGRSDLSSSLHIEDVNCSEILDISLSILVLAKKYNLKVTLGGCLSAHSYEFIKILSSKGLDAFESRKCTFIADQNMTREKYEELTNLGINFEIDWINFRNAIYQDKVKQGKLRINDINKRLYRK